MYRSSMAKLDIMGRGAPNVEMAQEAAAGTFGVCFMFLTPGIAAGVVVAVPGKVNRANGEEDEHDLYEAPRELPVGEMASWKH